MLLVTGVAEADATFKDGAGAAEAGVGAGSDLCCGGGFCGVLKPRTCWEVVWRLSPESHLRQVAHQEKHTSSTSLVSVCPSGGGTRRQSRAFPPPEPPPEGGGLPTPDIGQTESPRLWPDCLQSQHTTWFSMTEDCGTGPTSAGSHCFADTSIW